MASGNLSSVVYGDVWMFGPDDRKMDLSFCVNGDGVCLHFCGGNRMMGEDRYRRNLDREDWEVRNGT